MTSVHWERVAAGRYASELHGHTIQAIRKDGPHSPAERPYMAVVDRVPVDIGAWSLNQAKTQAIQHVQRQLGKKQADRLFTPKNGHKPAEPPMIPDPVDAMLPPPAEDLEPDHRPDGSGLDDGPPQLESKGDELVQQLPELTSRPDLFPLERFVLTEPPPGHLTITGTLHGTDAGFLAGLNHLQSALALLREHSDIECSVSMPPVLKL